MKLRYPQSHAPSESSREILYLASSQHLVAAGSPRLLGMSSHLLHLSSHGSLPLALCINVPLIRDTRQQIRAHPHPV